MTGPFRTQTLTRKGFNHVEYFRRLDISNIIGPPDLPECNNKLEDILSYD